MLDSATMHVPSTGKAKQTPPYLISTCPGQPPRRAGQRHNRHRSLPFHLHTACVRAPSDAVDRTFRGYSKRSIMIRDLVAIGVRSHGSGFGTSGFEVSEYV